MRLKYQEGLRLLKLVHYFLYELMELLICYKKMVGNYNHNHPKLETMTSNVLVLFGIKVPKPTDIQLSIKEDNYPANINFRQAEGGSEALLI